MSLNPWRRGDGCHEPAEPMKPLVDAAGWKPGEFATSNDWIYVLSAEEIAEIDSALRSVEARGLDLADIAREDFPLPRLSAALDEIRTEVMLGRGFALIRGLKYEELGRLRFARVFWGLGQYIGAPIVQNMQGHLLGHVVDQHGVHNEDRANTTAAALDFHCDSCDVLGLACLHPGKSGGEHRIASSVTLYNEMLRRRPDLVMELTGKFYRSRPGDGYGLGLPWITQSVFSFQDGWFTSRGASPSIYKAQTIPGVPKLTELQKEALQTYNKMAEELAFDIPFLAGDLFFVTNHTLMHARHTYEDGPDFERKRYLFRLWLRNGMRPLPEDIASRMGGVNVEKEKRKASLELV